jgi:hypothetical protein
LFILATFTAETTIIDRIAIIVYNVVVKDSDINRDIRVVSFLNQQKLNFDLQTRREAANRLIDQSIIQREIQVGEYQVPSESDTEQLYQKIQHERAPTPAAFQRQVAAYGLTAEDLKSYLQWQLTVLRFIDQRFRPAVLVTDEDIEQYYREHLSQFRDPRTGEPKSPPEVRNDVREAFTNERINQQFETWINARRKSAKIQYREEALR